MVLEKALLSCADAIFGLYSYAEFIDADVSVIVKWLQPIKAKNALHVKNERLFTSETSQIFLVQLLVFFTTANFLFRSHTGNTYTSF